MKANAVISGAMNNRAASSGFQTEMTRYRLGDVADVIVGYPFDGHKYSRDGVPVVRGENVTIGALRWDIKKCWIEDFPLADEYSLQDEDIVIGMDGSRVGRNRAQITMQDLPLLLAQRVACVRAKAGLYDQSFLYYQIFSQSFESYVNTIQSGSAVPHISQKQIEDFPVSGLDFTKQRVIGKFLSALDRKIALNRRKIATLEKMAKEIYDYWFVQYDFPDANGHPYKSSGGEMVYSPELKREIPKGWKVVDMRTVCDVVDCLHSKKPEFHIENQDEYLLTLENITRDGYVDLKKRFNISASDYQNWIKNIEIRENDFVITNAGRAGDVAMVPRGVKCAAGRNMTVIRPHAVNPYYLRSFFKSSYMDMQVKTGLEPGALFMNFNVHAIKKLRLLVPDTRVMDQSKPLLGTAVVEVERCLAEISLIESLRDFLLPLLMNGQVRIGGAA